MYCPNCGTKNGENAKFCSDCGNVLASNNANQIPKVTIPGKRNPVVRFIMTLYVIGWLVVIFFSFLIYWSENQSSTVIDPQTSYITCTNGTTYTYAQVGIYNPATDYDTDTTQINSACNNSGPNTYTSNYENVKQGKNPVQAGFIAFAVGFGILEAGKAGLMFLTQGYVPDVGSFSRKSKK